MEVRLYCTKKKVGILIDRGRGGRASQKSSWVDNFSPGLQSGSFKSLNEVMYTKALKSSCTLPFVMLSGFFFSAGEI